MIRHNSKLKKKMVRLYYVFVIHLDFFFLFQLFISSIVPQLDTYVNVQ